MKYLDCVQVGLLSNPLALKFETKGMDIMCLNTKSHLILI